MFKEFKTLSFKDQPDGKCIECKWNESSSGTLWCDCPNTHLTNLVCIQKRMMVSIQNCDYYLSDEY